ncbi:MAG: hypothetical protein JJV96_02925 [Alphaproteobacteria bacterium]|nr:hypothetical protein [Alphaproteobacteria bacterium]
MKNSYSAKNIKVLEKLEPVRLRPGMYIGGTDERAYHHLFGEVFDNSMDEVVAGFGTDIWVKLISDTEILIVDNGRGIPVDEHPTQKGKSALEVIFSTLHAGGKFDNDAYLTSGGLHGVGASIVNALSQNLTVQVVKEAVVYSMKFSRGETISKLEKIEYKDSLFKDYQNIKNGTAIYFSPDPEIFDTVVFNETILSKFLKNKAFLYKGVKIYWKDDSIKTNIENATIDGDQNSETIQDSPSTKEETLFHFKNGLGDLLDELAVNTPLIFDEPFIGNSKLADNLGTFTNTQRGDFPF